MIHDIDADTGSQVAQCMLKMLCPDGAINGGEPMVLLL